MRSLVLVDSSYDYHHAGAGGDPAKGDQDLLPLGLIQKPSADGTKTAIDPAQQRHQKQPSVAASETRPSPTPPSAATAAVAGDRPPSGLPSPPEGPPVMVLFPATLHLAMFFVPPPRATLVSAVMSLMVMLGSWGWGWGMLSTAGVGSGLAAGFAAGFGVRMRPVGGWSYAALVSWFTQNYSVWQTSNCTGAHFVTSSADQCQDRNRKLRGFEFRPLAKR